MKLPLPLSFFVTLLATWPVVSGRAAALGAQTDAVAVHGLLGEALTRNLQGRIQSLPTFNDRFLLRIYTPEARAANQRQDWNGEHAGKWLYAAALAAVRTHDAALRNLLRRTAGELIATQENDGYLGTYSAAQRFTNSQGRHLFSWDLWNASLMTLGLLETHRLLADDRSLAAATKLGELFIRTFGDGRRDVTEYGTRRGSSATVLLDALVELFRTTGDRRYLDLTQVILRQIEARDGFRMVAEGLKEGDAETIADGKAYQLLWNLTALAKLHTATGNPQYLTAAANLWQNVKTFHLTPGGGPWGGIGKHLECFNRKGYWSPYGLVETCSTLAWLQFNCELLRITGDARYAQEIETAAYNALLGAQYPDGQMWCYHSFENGRRHLPVFTQCCSSSGMMALEEVARIIYARRDGGIACNLWAASETTLELPEANRVSLSQQTEYPFDGRIRLAINPTRAARFPLFLRIPAWVEGAGVQVNGQRVPDLAPKSGTFAVLDRRWQPGDVVTLEFPLRWQVLHRTERIGVPQAQKESIHALRWFALTRGPLVYAANGLIAGRDREGVFPLPADQAEAAFKPIPTPAGFQGPACELHLPDRPPLVFLPAFEAGGRAIGTWHLTWIQQEIR